MKKISFFVLFYCITTNLFSQSTYLFEFKEKVGNSSKSNPVEIYCPEINNNGLASIYDSYTFSATQTNGAITNYQWQYKLKKKDGSYEVRSSATSPTLTIQPQSPLSSYYRNSDGHIVGEITLSGQQNGAPFNSEYFIYLQCEPGDISYSIKINRINDWQYNLDITLISKGSDLIAITTKDYSSNFAVTQHLEDHKYLTYRTFNFTYGSDIQFTFLATNRFGRKEVVYNMEPVYYYTDTYIEAITTTPYSLYPNPAKNTIHFSGDPNQIESVTIFDASGKNCHTIHRLQSDGIDISLLGKGIYFVEIKTKTRGDNIMLKLIKN